MNIYFGYKSIDLDDCELIGDRNFAGLEKIKNGRTVNGEGRRNFLVKITEDQFDMLREKGWDVGRFSQQDPNKDPDCFLRVNISYYKNPPIVHYISSGVDTLLDEDHLRDLDCVNMKRLDIRAAEVNKQKMDGTWVKKPFVNELWATVTADRFRERYSNLNTSNSNSDDSIDEDVPFRI